MATYAICSTDWWNNEANQAAYAGYYNSLAAWVAAREGAITEDEIAEIQGDDWQANGQDTTAISLVGFSASAGIFLRIRTIGLARHLGVWSESRYILRVGTTGRIITYPNLCDVEVDGLQVEQNGTGVYGGFGLGTGTTNSRVHITKNNIIRLNNTNATSGHNGIDATTANTSSTIFNNVFIGAKNTLGRGVYCNYFSGSVYNNTVVGFGEGIRLYSSAVIKNNIVMGCTTPYSNSGGTIEYNAFDSGTDPGLYGVDLSGKTTSDIFTNPAVIDYSLLVTAIEIRQKGANLSVFFTTDIAGQTRPASPDAWDLGAWHYSGTAVGDPVDIKIQNVVVGTMVLVLDPSDGTPVTSPFSMIADTITITYEYFEDTLLELRARKSSVGDPVRYLPLTMYGIATNRGVTFYLSQIPDPALN